MAVTYTRYPLLFWVVTIEKLALEGSLRLNVNNQLYSVSFARFRNTSWLSSFSVGKTREASWKRPTAGRDGILYLKLNYSPLGVVLKWRGFYVADVATAVIAHQTLIWKCLFHSFHNTSLWRKGIFEDSHSRGPGSIPKISVTIFLFISFENNNSKQGNWRDMREYTWRPIFFEARSDFVFTYRQLFYNFIF